MTQFTLESLPPLRITMDALMHRHGTLAVLAAAVTGIFRAATLRRDLSHMSDHMRQDIGLPPREDPARLRELMR